MKHSGPYQPKLVHEQPILYLPASGNDASGRGLGPDWVGGSGVTISHPTPASGFTTQFRRTRFTSVAVTTDQELGIHLPNAADCCCYRGASGSLGGFYFSARFIINAIPDTDVRFFCGLSAQNTGICISDTVGAQTVGLWCASTDACALKIVSRAAGSSSTTTLTGSPTLTTGIAYEFIMSQTPGAGSIVTFLYNMGTDAVISATNKSTDMPSGTTMLAPQIGLSNASNIIGADTSLDVISVYARPNQRLYAGQAV